jgi:pSer/pThr/pTyr-binding forkhead associated (FHA) protein
MKIKLKVLKGSNAGREVKIPTPKCLIGRSDECHLRPKSEAISRRHCVVFIKDGQVMVRDLGSKNGTYVNGKRVSEDVVVKSGDEVHFGPLGFELVVDHTLGGEKQPKVTSVKEAAIRASDSSKATALLDDSDISGWLDEADAAHRDSQYADPDTRQVVLDQTDQMTLQKAIEERARLAKERAAATAEEDSQVIPEADTKKKKKGPGKLPNRPDDAARDSQEAAAGALKKLFTNR